MRRMKYSPNNYSIIISTIPGPRKIKFGRFSEGPPRLSRLRAVAYPTDLIIILTLHKMDISLRSRASHSPPSLRVSLSRTL